ncbi:MAG: tRNA (N6-threonylcarbamoyladenosine(37)-N6)-methyltransferase TrmO [Deltaproteobacteria bacterium]|nr:tRNA (N6-threonylcarbamoyladenosine(37)-N6)-methyltransferase TrmO [Deltaproteobacteria bacterium]MBW2121988.1 tRNA (N6-threonylcarbamoyladenosine(37)-N6)-methyltransferase TrmO [Deltaproteobacteria bacterium]
MVFRFKSIGKIHTPYKEKAPYQPVDSDPGDFRVVLLPRYAAGLSELASFRYIYLIYYLDRLEREVSMMVSPPWAGGKEVGVFASRSPVRPNPIGLSVVRLVKIVENQVFTSGLDVFDGTPLLDIKPYIKDLDSKPDANQGWVDRMEGREHLSLHIRGIPHDY